MHKKNYFLYIIILIILILNISLFFYYKNRVDFIVNEKLILEENIKILKEENYIIKKDKLKIAYFGDKEILGRDNIIINNYGKLLGQNINIIHSHMPSSGVCYDSLTKLIRKSGKEEIIFGDKNKKYCSRELEYLKEGFLRFPICYASGAGSGECEQAVFDYDLFNKTWEFIEVKYFITDYEDEFLDSKNGFEGDETFGEFIRFFDDNYKITNRDSLNKKYFIN